MEKKIRLACFTQFETGGIDGYNRIAPYVPFLEQHGIEIRVYPLLPQSFLQRFLSTGRQPALPVRLASFRRLWQLLFFRQHDLVYIENELLPFFSSRLEQWLLRKPNILIADLDDRVFLQNEKTRRLVMTAQAVIVSGEKLEARYSGEAKRIIKLPTPLRLPDYRSVRPAIPRNESKPHFRIGWMGTPSTSSNGLSITDCLRQLHNLYHIEIVLIGFDRKHAAEWKDLPHTIYDRHPDTDASWLKTCDAAVMPLLHNTPADSRHILVLQQYMACGLPFVASPSAGFISLNQGNDNLFARSAFEWYSCLAAMIQNKEGFRETGRKNTDIIASCYSAESFQQQYLALFTELAGNNL